MQKSEIERKTHHFIQNFSSLTSEERLRFVRFNRYHSLHVIKEVIQLYLQNPEAKHLKTFEEWKALTQDSSVLAGEHALRIYRGTNTEYLFDVSQTTVATTFEPYSEALEPLLFLNSLIERSNPQQVNRSLRAQEILSLTETYTREFLIPYLSTRNRYTPEENSAAVMIALDANFERFGLLSPSEEPYSRLLEAGITRAFERIKSTRWLDAMNLGNSFSRGLNAQIEQNLEKFKNNQKTFAVSTNDEKVSGDEFIIPREQGEPQIEQHFEKPTGSDGSSPEEGMGSVSDIPVTPKIDEVSHDSSAVSLFDFESAASQEISTERKAELPRPYTWEELLQRGSQVVEGKFRILSYFEVHAAAGMKEKVNFLRKEYGLGGWASPADNRYEATYVNWDAKGIELNRELKSWNILVPELEILIHTERYLTGKEKLEYQVWQDKQKILQTPENFPGHSMTESEKEQSNPPKESVRTPNDFSFTTYLEESLKSFYPLTPTQKIILNLKAIQLVKELRAQNEHATPSQQKLLAQYVGWGGLANTFFDERNPRFEEFRKNLKLMVSSQDYASLRESSLTSYYTDPRLIQELYKALEHLGFKGGRILDPSMGTGNFFASLPQALKEKSELYGVELDQLSGTLASQLQQSTHVQIKGFEDTHFSNNSMDLVVTNVPFGAFSISDKAYEQPYVIHDYFIKKSLDLVHDGGFVAVLTSTHTLDKKDSRFRAELAETANLVSAVRLPDHAFARIAGTEIATDFLLFQKTKTPTPNPEWLETTSLKDDKGNRIFYNQYFETHPEQVLGTIGIKSFRGGSLSVKADYDLDDLPYEFSAALENYEVSRYFVNSRSEEVFEPAETLENELPQEVFEKIDPYTLRIVGGKPYYHNGESIKLFQKTASLTLNVNETRQAQLKRYETIKPMIFDEQAKWKPIAAYSGIIRDGEFIAEQVNDSLDFLPSQEVLEKLKQEKVLEAGNRKYERTSTGLKISEKVTTQYFYHQPYSSENIEAMSQMIELRQTLQKLLAIQHVSGYDRDAYETLRLELNSQYDAFRERFGAISAQPNALLMRQDDYYDFLASIEEEREDEQTKEPVTVKGTVFFEPTIQPEAGQVEVNSAEDALLASLNHKGRLDFEYMQDIYQKTKEEIIQELGNKLFYMGEGNYQTREEYLSGDVKTKLQTAKNHQTFALEDRDWTNNISALESVIPRDLPLSDINYKLGTRFIPEPIYQEFLAEAFEQRRAEEVSLIYDSMSDSYEVKLNRIWTDANRRKYGVGKYDGEHLADTLLNQREPQIFMPDPHDLTGKKRILDKEATADIVAKGEQLKADFKEWVLKHPEAQQEIVAIYNDTFNRTVPKTYDGSSLTVSGLAQQFSLRPHQKNAIMRIVQERRAGLFHEVGSGKTLTMLASSMKLKELGIIQKPMYVVPKPLLEQFGREIYTYFPESKVLIAHNEDFTKANRKRFISRIATGKYDAIVVADSQFEKVAMSQDYQAHYILEQLEEVEHYLLANNEKDYTVKKTELLKKNLEARLKKLQKQEVDTFINFEELGIDMLYVDEAHNYKNLAPMSQLQNVKGVSDTRSQKAMDLQQKVRYLQSLHDNAHVVFATGTPISNSVTELYTMMNYLAPDILARHRIKEFDAWVSTFGTIESVFELTAAGSYRIKRRFTKFGNMPELRNLFREVADIQTAEDLNLPVPEVETFAHQTQTTLAQSDYIEELIKRADKIEAGGVGPWEDNMLKIVGENRKLTLDMRMLDDSKYTSYDSDKLEQVADEVFKIWQRTQAQKSTQMIFSDLGVPAGYKNTNSYNADKSVNRFSAYDELKRQLVGKGIPDQEIRFIHEATEVSKENMMREMRAGKIRILMASTSKGGTGLNVQDKLIAVHHLDVPWRPSDITQRNGRIIRQGNENEKVQIHHYITKGSMDSFLWQTQENKLKFVTQIMNGKSDAREMEEMDSNDMNPSAFKSLSEGDPVKAEYMQLERELKLLTDSRNRYYESKAADEKRLESQKLELPHLQKQIEGIKSDLQQASATQYKPFEISLFYQGQERRYGVDDKKSEIGDRFIQLIQGNHSGEIEQVKIAEYRGFDIYHFSKTQTNLLRSLENGGEMITLKGQSEYRLKLPLTSGQGTLERINHKIDSLSKDKETAEQELMQLQSAVKRVEESRDKPFSKEEEFQEKTRRYGELRSELEKTAGQAQDTPEMKNSKVIIDDYEVTM
ncbi:SNF2-related protein [Lactovum odontotermitis]